MGNGRISTNLASSGWFDILVDTLILMETWGSTEAEFSSYFSKQDFWFVTLGALPAQDLKWDSKDKGLYPEKCSISKSFLVLNKTVAVAMRHRLHLF